MTSTTATSTPTEASTYSSSATTVYLALAALVCAVYYYYKLAHEETWSQYGVRSPKLSRFHFVGENFREKVTELLNQYGGTFGIKTRGRFALVTADLDLIRHVMIKDSNNFVDRAGKLMSRTSVAKSLFFAKGEEWRRHRQIVSPTFTSGKLKHISKSVDKSAQDLAAFFEKCANESTIIDVKDVSGRYSGEIIAKTAFGLDVSFISHKDEEFYEHAKNLLYIRRGLPFIILDQFIRFIPFVQRLCTHFFKMQLFDRINLEAHKYFDAVLKTTIAERKQQGKQRTEKSRIDFLDLLLKASDDASVGQIEKTDDESIAPSLGTPMKPLKGLTEEEILGHSMLLIFAGLETTATTLQMCLYELAVNQDIQEKVYQEIQRVVTSESPTPEELTKLSYTEQVINETLRMYPPLPIVNRVAKETKTYNGITIPKDAVVMIPIHYFMKNPNFFPQPEKFDPDRFSPEEKEKRDPMAFIPFGNGPRICLGMRLAYLELKQSLVHVLRRVKVVLNESTQPREEDPKIEITYHELLHPVKPIMLACELRLRSPGKVEEEPMNEDESEC